MVILFLMLMAGTNVEIFNYDYKTCKNTIANTDRISI